MEKDIFLSYRKGKELIDTLWNVNDDSLDVYQSGE